MTLERLPVGGRPVRARLPVSGTALALFVILAAALAIAPRAAGGAEVLRESYAPSTWDTSFANVWANQKVAQSFVARTSFLLTHLDLHVFDQPGIAGPDILQVSIADDAGNQPGNVLASTARAGLQNWTWVAFSFYPWVPLAVGRTFWIVAEDAEPRPKGYEWAMNTPGDFESGEARWFDPSSGVWLDGAGADLFFKAFGVSGPSIVLDVSPGLRPADPGTLAPLYVHFNNSGNDVAAGVRIDMNLDPGLSYLADDASLEGGTSIGPLAWAFANVAPGPHRMTVWILLEPNPAYFDGQSLSAWTFLNYTDSTGALHSPSREAATVTVLVPVIRLQAIPAPASVAPGQTFNFTVSFFNVGSGRAATLWVNATAGPRLAILGDDAATAGGVWVGTNAWRFTDVTGQVYLFNVTVRSDPTSWPGDRLDLRLNVTYTDGAGRVFHRAAFLGSAAIHGPSLVVEAVPSTARVHPDEPLSVTLHYNNTGDEPARRIWLNTTLPTDAQFLDSSPIAGVRTGGRLDYDVADVPPGPHSVTIRLRALLSAAPGTRLVTAASLDVANASSTLLRPSAATAETFVATPRFSMTIQPSATRIAPGDTIDIVLAWNNTGNEVAPRVWLNFTLPAKTLLVNSTSPWSSTDGSTYGWIRGNVGPVADAVTVRLEGSARLIHGEALVASATLAYERSDGVVLAASETSVTLEAFVDGSIAGFEVVFLWIAILVALFLLFLLLGYWDVLPRRRAAIDDLFLLHNSGILICHYSTTLRPDVDSDIASGMLMAVRNFVADALRTKNGALREMRYGEHRIQMVHGVHAILVVFARGRGGRNLEQRMAEVLRNVEMAYAGVLESWSGRTEDFRGVEEYLLRLVNL